MFSLRAILLLSGTVLLVVSARDTGKDSDELMPKITYRAKIDHSWWENGNHVHKYTVHIKNVNDVCIRRLGFELTGNTPRDMWGLEKYKDEGKTIYRTSDWHRTHPNNDNYQAGFIAVGHVSLKLVTVSEC